MVARTARGMWTRSHAGSLTTVSSTRPYLLDTTVLIDVSRSRQPALSWLDELLIGPSLVCVSAVTIAELFAGVRPTQRARSQTFIDRLTHWDVTTEIAVRAGMLRYDLARQGRALLIPDALIAATALAYGAVLVTWIISDFTVTGVPSISLVPRTGQPS
jgi:predicted nucleic acid-binding protein